jgi:hypothetical protein
LPPEEETPSIATPHWVNRHDLLQDKAVGRLRASQTVFLPGVIVDGLRSLSLARPGMTRNLFRRMEPVGLSQYA